MPSTLIHYFTGTGNTAYAVRMISENLSKAGHQVTTIQVSKDVMPSEKLYDFHLVAFPVLSWAPPVMMKHYLQKIPRSAGNKVAILAINGAIIHHGQLIRGFTGQALEEVESLLKKKNYDVFLTANASFPDNWTQMTNPCDEEGKAIIFPVGESEVESFISDFLADKRSLYRCGGFHKTWSWIIAKLFGIFGRRILGTFYMADDHCTGCSLCARICPSGTIVMKKRKPFWKDRCEDCNRCINLCPEKAIQVSLPLMIVQLVIHFTLFVWGIASVVHYTPLVLPVSKLLLIPAEAAFIILVMFLVFWITIYPLNTLFGLLQRIPGFRRFLSASHTNRFRRYSAPGFKPGKSTGLN